MKIDQSISFSKQLIIYLIFVLVIVFFFISMALANSLEQFINNNAYSQARAIASNVLIIFEREISRIESIPKSVTDMYGELTYENISDLPVRILRSYKTLIGSSIHYNLNDPEVGHFLHINAFRTEDEKIHFAAPDPACKFCYPDSSGIIKSDPEGYWIYSEVNHCKTIAFCHVIHNSQHLPCGILKIDFPLKNLNDLISGYTLFKSGNLFVIDQAGNYLAHPDPTVAQHQNIFNRFTGFESFDINQSIIRGESGARTIELGKQAHYIYYTPFQPMNWRIGIICPYSEILYSSGKLYFMLFLSMGLGLLCLFVGTINIVRRLSSPLIQLAYSTRRIAEGQFDIELPTPKSSKEISELYDSFHYLQQNLRKYIKQLKITTAEKEQYNSEMRLARRIQQRFLPRPIPLPENIELAADLRQCREVGGDFYEYFLLGNHLYFAIGDVAGKGTPAALYMASISKLFRYIASTNNSTALICNLINQHMCDDSDDDMYTTIFMGIIDINTGIMTFTNAGHPYPLIIHSNGQTNFLNKFPDMPVGVLENHVFSEHTYTFRKDTTLLFYTDGITDSENIAGQFYGQDKMIHGIESLTDKTPDSIIHSILEDLRQHIGQRNQSDDLTLLAIRYKGIPGSK